MKTINYFPLALILFVGCHQHSGVCRHALAEIMIFTNGYGVAGWYSKPHPPETVVSYLKKGGVSTRQTIQLTVEPGTPQNFVDNCLAELSEAGYRKTVVSKWKESKVEQGH